MLKCKWKLINLITSSVVCTAVTTQSLLLPQKSLGSTCILEYKGVDGRERKIGLDILVGEILLNELGHCKILRGHCYVYFNCRRDQTK